MRKYIALLFIVFIKSNAFAAGSCEKVFLQALPNQSNQSKQDLLESLQSKLYMSQMEDVTSSLMMDGVMEGWIPIEDFIKETDRTRNTNRYTRFDFYKEIQDILSSKGISSSLEKLSFGGRDGQSLVIKPDSGSHTPLSKIATALNKKGIKVIFNPYDVRNDFEPSGVLGFFDSSSKILAIDLTSILDDEVGDVMLHELTHLGSQLHHDKNGPSIFSIQFYSVVQETSSDPGYSKYYSFDEVKAHIRQLKYLTDKTLRATQNDNRNANSSGDLLKIIELQIHRLKTLSSIFDDPARLGKLESMLSELKWEQAREIRIIDSSSVPSNPKSYPGVLENLYKALAQKKSVYIAFNAISMSMDVVFSDKMYGIRTSFPLSKSASQKFLSLVNESTDKNKVLSKVKEQMFYEVLRDSAELAGDARKYDRHIAEQYKSIEDQLALASKNPENQRLYIENISRILSGMSRITLTFSKKIK